MKTDISTKFDQTILLNFICWTYYPSWNIIWMLLLMDGVVIKSNKSKSKLLSLYIFFFCKCFFLTNLKLLPILMAYSFIIYINCL